MVATLKRAVAGYVHLSAKHKMSEERRLALARRVADEFERMARREDFDGQRRALCKLARLYDLADQLAPHVEREALALDWPPPGLGE